MVFVYFHLLVKCFTVILNEIFINNFKFLIFWTKKKESLIEQEQFLFVLLFLVLFLTKSGRAVLFKRRSKV